MIHGQFKNILDRYIIPSEISAIFAKVLERKFKEKEGQDAEAERNVKKQLETLKTKLKTLNRRYALDEIGKDVYEEVKKDMVMEIHETERELEKYQASLSNLTKYINNSMLIASKLGYYWNKMDYQLCQKIQKLAYPNGIYWDGEKKTLRTDGENIFLSQIAQLHTIISDEGIKKQDTQQPVSCLVAGAGLEPATFGLWAQRAASAPPRIVIQTAKLNRFLYLCKRFKGFFFKWAIKQDMSTSSDGPM